MQSADYFVHLYPLFWKRLLDDPWHSVPPHVYSPKGFLASVATNTTSTKRVPCEYGASWASIGVVRRYLFALRAYAWRVPAARTPQGLRAMRQRVSPPEDLL